MKREGKRFDIILLDVDGTLLDFKMAETLGMKTVLKTYGFEPDAERLKLYHDINEGMWAAFERGEITKDRLLWERFKIFFSRLGRDIDGHEAEKLYRQQLDQSAFLIDGALETCAYLRERYDLYVVTNGTSSTQYKRLKASGLKEYMNGIFVSEDAGSQKPQKEYFDYCFARIPNACPERMMLVGDSLQSDIKGGLTAGTCTCWYNPKGLPASAGIIPDYEIRRLSELKEIL